MRRMAAGVFTFAIIVAGAARPSPGQPPASMTRTIWGGVYTATQAARGQQMYQKACGFCHRDNLQGDEGPPLVGSPFVLRWQDQTLAAMFDTIQGTMPQDAPSTLSAEDVRGHHQLSAAGQRSTRG